MLLGSGSIALYQNIDWSKEVYYCDTKVDLGPQYCVRFSTTGTRCYPNELNNSGYKDCSVGWTQLIQGQTIPTENTPEPTTITVKKEICSPPPNYGCKPLEE